MRLRVVSGLLLLAAIAGCSAPLAQVQPAAEGETPPESQPPAAEQPPEAQPPPADVPLPEVELPLDTQPEPEGQSAPEAQPATESEPAPESQPVAEEPAPAANDAARQEPALTGLAIGDNRLSSGPQAGYLWSCMTNFTGGGAESVGDWYDQASGTWDLTAKPVVDGSVTWGSAFSMTIEGDTRVITSNGLPFHATGTYPIAASDDAYQYDRNPNSITAQDYRLELPANPTFAAQPSCVAGEVGIAISGVVINNALDAAGRDAVATEVQDACFGHPHQGGVYHYHGFSACLEGAGMGHSDLIGWALDGFGIYGPYGENGEVLTSAALDACHGHTHVVDWDGQQVEMYHYHATYDFPYTVGCYRGTPIQFRTGGGGNAAPAGDSPTQGDAPPGGQDGSPPQGSQPPSGSAPPQGGPPQGPPPPR